MNGFINALKQKAEEVNKILPFGINIPTSKEQVAERFEPYLGNDPEEVLNTALLLYGGAKPGKFIPVSGNPNRLLRAAGKPPPLQNKPIKVTGENVSYQIPREEINPFVEATKNALDRYRQDPITGKMKGSIPAKSTSSKVANQSLYDKGEVVYHGGRDLGDNAVLKRGFYGGDGKTPTGQDSGGIFFTPDKNYAQGYAGGKGALYQKTLTKAEKESLFDLNNKDHVKRFVEGAKKWEGYDSPADAVNDAKQMIKSMQDTAKNGVPDWATASQWSEEIRQSGFRGAKFLERSGTVSGNDFDGFNISGKPIISYGFFDDAVPVTKVKNVAQGSIGDPLLNAIKQRLK
jgi:hypothetical protein